MNVWLTLHLLGAILFVGNIVTAAFWKIRADVRRNPAVIHEAVRNVMLADFVFTMPGLILLVISGIAMALRTGGLASGLNWLTAALLIFAVSGILWGAVLIPLQRAMIRHASGAVASGTISAAYRQASRLWAVVGTVCTLLPVIILYLMIAKPF